MTNPKWKQRTPEETAAWEEWRKANSHRLPPDSAVYDGKGRYKLPHGEWQELTEAQLEALHENNVFAGVCHGPYKSKKPEYII